MPDRLERQLSDELHRVAASANPPPDAWERFTRRVGSTPASGSTPAPPMRLVLLDPDTGNEIDGHQQPSATEFTMRTDETTSRPRGRLLLGAAAALAALAVAGVALAVSTDDDSDDDAAVSQPTEQTGTGGEDESAVDAFVLVTGAYDAFNEGSLVTWGAKHAPTIDPLDEFSITESAERDRILETRYDDVSCSDAGFGEYEFLDIDNARTVALTGHRVECSATYRDAMSVAAGIEIPREFVWVVRDGQVLYLSADGANFDWTRFEQGFLRWLSRDHPEVLEARGIELDPFRMEASEDDLPALLPYVDEFVEQSDQWPVEGD